MSKKFKILLSLLCVTIFSVGALAYTKAEDFGALRVLLISQGGTSLGDAPADDEILIGDGSGKYILSNISSAISDISNWLVNGSGYLTPSTTIDVYHSADTWTNGTASSTSLQVGGTASASFRGQGDIYATGGIKAMEGLFSEAQQYGAGLEVLSNGGDVISTNVMTGDATITASTQIITDTSASFGTPTSTYDSAFIRIVSSDPSFTGATGEITQVLNNEQLVVSFATAGLDEMVDATDMTYVIYEHPVLFAGDNGVVSVDIGPNEDAKFEVHIDDGTGFHGVYIDDTAGADQHQALTVDVDSQGYDGIVALDLLMQNSSSTNPSVGVQETMLNLKGDADNYSNSELRFINADLIGSGTDNDVDVIHINNLPLTGHIIHSGAPEEILAAYYDNGAGTTASTTDAFKSQGSDVTLFENDNAIIYVAGNTGTEFTNISFALSSEGNKNIDAEYYYCDGDDSWKTLPGVTDTTNGFQSSGSINFINPVDRGQCNEEIDSTAFGDTTAREYIAVKRTLNTFPGQKPIENLVSISGNGEYLYMDSYGLKPVGSAGAPYTCDASVAGMSYYDATAVALLWCDGSTWNEYAETADITIHNNLGGLQGGTSAEYYHLTSADYTEVSAWLPNVTLTSGGGMTLNSATTTDSLYVGGKLTVIGQTVEADVTQQNTTVNGTLHVTGETWLASATGNVGIGTTDPDVKFHVASGDFLLSNNQWLKFDNNAGDPKEIISLDASNDLIIKAANTQNIFFQESAGNTVMTITDTGATGNVGIGTTGPLAGLHVGTGGTPGNTGVNDVYIQNDLEVDGTINFAGDTRYGISKIYSSATGDMYGMEQASSAHTGGNPQLRLFTSNAASADFSIGKYTDATTFADWLFIKDSGNVGIGTTDPANKLDIKSSSINTAPLNIINSADTDSIFRILEDGGGDGRLYLYKSDATNNVLIDSSGPSYFNGGNVGIGTTGPTGSLQIAKSSPTTGYARANTYLGLGGSEVSGSDTHLIGMGYAGAAYYPTYFGSIQTNNGGSTYADLVFGTRSVTTDTQPSERMRIDSAGLVTIAQNLKVSGTGDTTIAGNVGIGTTTPEGLLDLSSSNSNIDVILGSIGANKDATIKFLENRGGTASGGFVRYDATANVFNLGVVQTDSSEDNVISLDRDSGNVGIGTTGPTGTLHIKSATRTYLDGIQFEDATGGTGDLWGIKNGAGLLTFGFADTPGTVEESDFTELVTFKHSGNVGIGTTGPGGILDVAGEIRITSDDSFASDVAQIYTTAGNGLVISGHTGTIYDFLLVDAGGTSLLANPVGTNNMVFPSSGNVGIGTTGPGYKLEVVGDIYINATTTIADDLQVNSRIIAVSKGGNTHHIPSGGDNSAFVIIDKNNTASDASLLLADQGALKWEVGMAGDNNFQWKTVSGSEGNYVFTNTLFMDYETNWVGIGTEVPSGKLDIATSTPESRAAMWITNKNTGAGSDGSMMVLSGNAGAWYVYSDVGLNGSDNFGIGDGSWPPKIFIDSSGNVGIATTTPGSAYGEAFTIEGDAFVNGTLYGGDFVFANDFTLTEGDKVGLDKNEVVLLNQNGEIIIRILDDGTIVSNQIEELEKRLETLEKRVGVLEKIFNWFKKLFNQLN